MLSSGVETTTDLPNELVFEILIWLPGKQVGRCRCVCKAWRKMIGGRPFQEIYRDRQRGLIFGRRFIINRDDGTPARCLQFFHCPLRRLKEPLEEFRPLPVIDLQVRMMGRSLLCVGECDEDGYESSRRLSLHNIGTGETTMIPDPFTCYSTRSTYHLGCDRASGEYKLLRLIFDSYNRVQGAHILTMRPPSSSHISTWRVLENGLQKIAVMEIWDSLSEVRQCCDDGLVCWIHYSFQVQSLPQNLLCFDFSKERFRFVEIPRDEMYNTFFGLTRFNGSLALWLKLEEDWKIRDTCCYLLRDEEEEGENWSRQSRQVSRYVEEIRGSVVFASGKFPGSSSSSNSDMMVMSDDPVSDNQRVYSYCRRELSVDADKEKEGEEEIFFVGELPGGGSYLIDEYPFHCMFASYQDGVHCCLLESSHLYLSLDDILDPASANML